MNITKILGIGFSGILIMAAVLVVGYVGFTNDANSAEINIQAQYKDNQNVYDNGFKKVQEVAQVPTEQVAALKDIYLKAIQGTYGENGSSALFQAMKERDINIDQSTYVRVQQVIEEFRNRFQQAQTEMVSRTQSYDKLLHASSSGRFYNMLASYPHIDMEKYTKLVTSDQTEDAFKTKKAQPLDVFGKKQ